MAPKTQAELQLTATNQTAAAFAAVQGELRKIDEAVAKLGRNQTDQTRKTAEGWNLFGAAVNRVVGAASIAAIEEYSRRSIVQFGKVEHAMNRVRDDTNASVLDMARYKQEFSDLALQVNKSSEEVAGSFLKFFNQNTLDSDVAVTLFKNIALQANIAGVDIDAMARAASAAMHNLHVSAQDMPAVMDAWRSAAKGVWDQFTEAAPRITNVLQRFGLTGKAAAVDTASVFKQMQLGFGTTRAAATAFSSMLEHIASEPYLTTMFSRAIQNGGSLADALDAVMERLKRQKVFDTDPAVALAAQRRLGMSQQTADAFKNLHDNIANVRASSKAAFENVGTLELRIKQRANETNEALHSISESLNQLMSQFGENLTQMLHPKLLADFLQKLVMIERVLAALERVRQTYSIKQLFGAAPSQEHLDAKAVFDQLLSSPELRAVYGLPPKAASPNTTTAPPPLPPLRGSDLPPLIPPGATPTVPASPMSYTPPGAAPTGPGTRADRNNNIGNIKFSPLAQQLGATHADKDGFAVFPDRETGIKAAEALLNRPAYANLTLDEIGSKWANGDPNWAANVSKATGIPGGTVPNVEQRSQIVRAGMPKAEGTRLASLTPPSAMPGGTPPADVLARAREVAPYGPAAVRAFINSQGYNVSTNWCGEFAASVIKSTGGTPPANPAIASNWRNYGQEVPPGTPGSIAVRRGVPTGAIGSHVTIANTFGDNTFTGIGGNQRAGRVSTFPINRYQFFDKPAAQAWPPAAPPSSLMMDQYMQMRQDMERPIKMQIEAPQLPSQIVPEFRRSSARDGLNREVRNARWATFSDIGAA